MPPALRLGCAPSSSDTPCVPRRQGPLSGSPAVCFLSYGKHKDGYWTYEHFAEQTDYILDMYEALYPGPQVLIEVD